MTSEKVKLFCILEDDSSAFEVKLAPDDSIAALKEAIKGKNPNDLQGVDPDKLVLWSISIPSAPKRKITLANLTDEEKANKKPEELEDSTSEISEVFDTAPPKKTIHVIVQRPSAGLPYQAPNPLLHTTGLSWEYQPDPELYPMLRKTIKEHYTDFVQNRRDKLYMPLYLFLCGAGTGKSRNAQEFHKSAFECLSGEGQDEQELRDKIKDAWVFHVSFENGTSPLPDEASPIQAIGNRMLLQLLPHKELYNIISDYNQPHPMDVLNLVAKSTSQTLETVPVILVVDGLQSFTESPDDGTRVNSKFYQALTNIGDLAVGKVFLMICCTATVTSPVDYALASTQRKRVPLPVASLNSPSVIRDNKLVPVFDESDHITKVLVSDCGGHGRALESLQEVIKAAGGVADCNVEVLLNDLYFKLRERYSVAISITSKTATAMVRAMLTRTLLDPDKALPGTTKKPGQLAIPGLIRYVQSNGIGSEGYLTAPYIWVWLFSYQPEQDKDPLLKNWCFNDYSEINSKLDPRSPPGAQFWQHFEHFLATFRCLKSRVLEDEELTTISTVHAGARLNGDITFKNHHLALEISSHQEVTKSTPRNSTQVKCENNNVDIMKCRDYIVNGVSAPHGDGFLGLDAQPFCTEVHQCKLVNNDPINYLVERKKAASDSDFFILFTSKVKLDVQLPNNSGVVDMSNWNSYFGPFAGRAFVFATTGALDINEATRKDLERMKGIDKIKANLIVDVRTKRAFESLEDADERLPGVGKSLLMKFKFPRIE
ncbi:hypothetical protein BGX27_001539 [Mortierella sp. AM989]|nr:hypothetical protein BGX27_001539 [Mortierella sp. AM989]